LIDGNNLIGKIKKLFNLQKKDGQAARSTLVLMLERNFEKNKQRVNLFFDGFENEAIPFSLGKIVYSDKKTADEEIKLVIENSNSRRNLVVVSSDIEIINFAKSCGCGVILSEEFAKKLSSKKNVDEEKTKIQEIDNVEEFKKLFGVGKGNSK
jgi:predicted RNA-binding protein with PIN domain